MKRTLNLLCLALALTAAACTQRPVVIIEGGGGGGGGGAGGAGDYCSGTEVVCYEYLVQPAGDGDSDDGCESCTEGQVCADDVCVDGSDEGGGDSHK